MNTTTLLLGLQAALIALSSGVVALTSIEEDLKALIVLVCSVLLAFIGPFLPKVSSTVRHALELRRS